MCGMIENLSGVKRLAVYTTFEMQMLRRGTAGTSHKGYHLTGFHYITHFHKVLGIMTVQCLDTTSIAYFYSLSVSAIRL